METLTDEQLEKLGEFQGLNNAHTLVQALQLQLNRVDGVLNNVRADRERHDQARILKEQQDAYNASLKADQEKARRAQEEWEQLAKEEEEEERKQREILDKRENKRRKIYLQENMLPEPPTSDTQDVAKIGVHLPSGERLTRRFKATHSTDLYNFFELTSERLERPLFQGEIDENRLPDLQSEYAEPYRQITDSLPLVINCLHGGCPIEIYGMLVFKAKLLNNITIDLLLNVKFLKFKSVILDQEDSLADGDISLPFAVIIRIGQQLPITFKSPSAEISYSLSFRFTQGDIFNTVLGQFTFRVHVGPSWVAAPPPEMPQLHSEDDGIRIVLDLEGDVQGNLSVLGNTNMEMPWLRPRALNNIVQEHSYVQTATPAASPAYSEVDENSFNEPAGQELANGISAPPNTPRSPVSGVSFKRSQSEVWQPLNLTLLRRLNRSLSHESIVVAVNDNEPLPYTEEDPLSFVMVRPSSLENVTSGARTSQSATPPPHPSRVRDHISRPRFELVAPSTEPEEDHQLEPPVIFTTLPEHTSMSPTNLFSLISRSLKDMKEYGTQHGLQMVPLFRILIPCTMAGPGSLLPMQVHIESLPRFHTAKSMEVILQASVKCKALGATKTDVTPFVCHIVLFESTDAIPLQKQIDLQVPASEEMGVLGCGFKAPLVELRHQIVFNLHTEYKSKRGAKTAKFELGSVSIELMR
ncbi:UNVERIFIED_CONTAM: hypothetical protein HDU68_002987 [Siphonaria sp. JEL0065]|nr:hypothetical protein HDU68_002987 [Siphonaria sp. JEL0065]